jgi:hypothetical protein
MASALKHFVIAPRRTATAPLAEDWQEQIAGSQGISVLGHAFGRLQVSATDEAIQSASAQFGQSLLIEEAAPRRFAAGESSQS